MGALGGPAAQDLESLLGSWPTTPAQALAVQETLRQRVIRDDALPGCLTYVAGVDVAYAASEGDAGDVYAGVVVLDARTPQPVECVSAQRASAFPYVPGLFAFRELPAVLQALQQLSTRVDLLVCDAQGVAHPRRFGLASHLGCAAGQAEHRRGQVTADRHA
jgi:deoxyribonuclease V